jgi:transcription elongation factor Elf1
MAGRRMLEPLVIHCPYCGEAFETSVDLSAGSQHYIEDCAVCCRPIEVHLKVSDDGELMDVYTSTDND